MPVGVLNTATQAGSAAGVAAIGVIFFAAVPEGAPSEAGLADALSSTLPWIALILVVSVALMTLLPRTARSEHQLEPQGDRSSAERDAVAA